MAKRSSGKAHDPPHLRRVRLLSLDVALPFEAVLQGELHQHCAGRGELCVYHRRVFFDAGVYGGVMKVEISTAHDDWHTAYSRHIGRTRSPIVDMELALNKEVVLIKKADGSIYGTTDLIKGKMVKIK